MALQPNDVFLCFYAETAGGRCRQGKAAARLLRQLPPLRHDLRRQAAEHAFTILPQSSVAIDEMGNSLWHPICRTSDRRAWKL
jgi:hypothetical protein